MPRSLAFLLTLTDISFLIYWTLAALSQLELVAIPPEWMYADYTLPRVVAWNWSFLPLDLAFSYFGLRAVGASRKHQPWQSSALVSLTLTMTAGGMAISYWAILREFDPVWFGSNALLVLWPLFFIGNLLRADDRLQPDAN